MTSIPFTLGSKVVAGQLYSFQGYVYEALRSGKRSTEPKVGVYWKLTPPPVGNDKQVTELQATVSKHEKTIADLQAALAKPTPELTEALRRLGLCVCGAKEGMVAPSFATELREGKVVEVTDPWNNTKIELLFPKPPAQ